MKDVTKEETYWTTLGAIKRPLGRLEQVWLMILAGVQVLQDFMVIFTTSYKMLLGINFLFKVDLVLNFEQVFIQIKRGSGTNMQVLKLHEIHMAMRESSEDSQSD